MHDLCGDAQCYIHPLHITLTLTLCGGAQGYIHPLQRNVLLKVHEGVPERDCTRPHDASLDPIASCNANHVTSP